jgi:ATP-binding cassette subfamily G (WHITE) protein 1
MVLHFLVGIVLGLNYYRSGNDGSKTISNVGFFIISTVYLAYTSLMPAVLKCN